MGLKSLSNCGIGVWGRTVRLLRNRFGNVRIPFTCILLPNTLQILLLNLQFRLGHSALISCGDFAGHSLQHFNMVTTTSSTTLSRPTECNVNRRFDRTFIQLAILRLPLRWRSRARLITFARSTESCVQRGFGCAFWILRIPFSELDGVCEGR